MRDATSGGRRWRWVSENPLELVEPPPLPDTDTETLGVSEISAVIAAYRTLEADAEEDGRYWYAAARRMTIVGLSTGLRRGELLGLRWQDVELLGRLLHVRQAFVRNAITTPKSKAGAKERRSRARRDLRARGAVRRESASYAGVNRVLPSRARYAARPVQAHGVRADGAPPGRCRQVVPPVARAATHGSHRDRRGRRPVDVRSGQLSIRAGEIVALVGENGSGKTTLAKLLAGLYRPTTGTITWDGVDINGVDAAELRTAIAAIFQDFLHFHLRARDNVGLGRVDFIDDLDDIQKAARHADADAFLSTLPNGYETVLGPEFEGGSDLSIGQWQRVALARAFFRQAPFVILDEPAAALDPRAEHELFERIRALLGGRTVLLISHRFSSVRNADRIYVLQSGRVTEAGTHEELMERQGHYAELFQLQAVAYLAGRHDARDQMPAH